MDPAVHGEEPLAVLHLDVAPEQQHGEGADQRGLPQVHAGIPDLPGGRGVSQLKPGIDAPASHEPFLPRGTRFQV